MKFKKVKFFIYKIIALSFLGILCGIGVFVFLKGLEFIYFDASKLWNYSIWFFPLAAWLMGWLQDKKFTDSVHVSTKIFSRDSNPNLKYSFFITMYSWLSHIFSASVGREGAAVQIAGGIGNSFSKSEFLMMQKDFLQQNKTFLLASFGAGFAAALNAPLAGIMFATEVTVVRKLQWRQIPWIAISSFFAWLTVGFLPVQRMSFPAFDWNAFALNLNLNFILCIGLGLAAGLIAAVFSLSINQTKKWSSKYFKNSSSLMFFGAVLIVLYSLVIKTDYYSGLGTEHFTEIFRSPHFGLGLCHKLFLTYLAISFGFRGGEFVPLVFCGALLGNVWYSSVTTQIVSEAMISNWSSIGYLSVFAGAANIPITGTILAIETFGLHIGPWAFVVCYLSYLSSGYFLKLFKYFKLTDSLKKIYSSQDDQM